MTSNPSPESEALSLSQPLMRPSIRIYFGMSVGASGWDLLWFTCLTSRRFYSCASFFTIHYVTCCCWQLSMILVKHVATWIYKYLQFLKLRKLIALYNYPRSA